MEYPTVTQAAEKIVENRTAYAKEVARIQADGDYTPDAKRRKITELHTEATDRHRELRRAYEEAKQDVLASLKRSAFGLVTHLLGRADQLAVRSAHTAALDRAGQTENHAQLARLMQSAITAEDEITAVSVASVAYDRGFTGILESFVEAYPHRRQSLADYQRYESQLQDTQSKFGEMVALTGPTLPSRI